MRDDESRTVDDARGPRRARGTGPWRLRSGLFGTPEKLQTVGELVGSGGARAALGIGIYIVIGSLFWSLIGYLLDWLMGTGWIVFLGLGVGVISGFILIYAHLQAGLSDAHTSDSEMTHQDRP